jgi:DNA primase
MRISRRPNFKKLRDVPIHKVLDLLQLDLKKKGYQLRGSCPICEHPSDRCLTVTPKLNRWWCFGCRSGGDPLQLYAEVRQLTLYAAACELQQIFEPS